MISLTVAMWRPPVDGFAPRGVSTETSAARSTRLSCSSRSLSGGLGWDKMRADTEPMKCGNLSLPDELRLICGTLPTMLGERSH